MNKTPDSQGPTRISDSRDGHTVIFDSAKVRVGALSPAFPASDMSKVRMGALSPAFPRARETSKVRIGALSPAFPPR